MQDPDMVEMPSRVEVSNWSFLKHLSAETRSSSLPETGEGADRDHFGQNRKLNGLFELEVVQESLPGRDGDGGNYDATPDSFPDAFAGEASSTWGDFKGFSEVKLENLSHIPESLENLNGEQASTNDTDVSDNHGTTSCGQIFPRTAEYSRRDVFPNVPLKASLSPEEVIKRSFPEIPVPQFLENIGGLNQMLDTQTEEVDIPEHTKMQLCTDSGIFWKTLNHARNPSGLRCPWNESHCQENLLAVLGIDAHQKILSERKDDVLEKSNIKENEDSSADKFSISKALIQTKLSVSPDPRQSHLFTYNLFLKKTPSTGNMQYITVPQKKRIFTTQSLKMKMFSSNVC